MEENEKFYGLSESEVIRKRKNGEGNKKDAIRTKSYRYIFFENIFSLFNFLNLAIAVVLIEVGSIKNCLFMIVVICNTFIGIIQEIRSKRTVDRLSIVNRTSVSVIREGVKREINIHELVKGDLIELSSGCQVSNDCRILKGSCEVNESLVTGESDSVFRPEGEKLLSGSFLVSGKCVCRVLKTGKENYADSVLGQIKYVKKSNSEIVNVIRKIIVVISICIVPFGVMLFYNQYTLSHSTLKEAAESSSAALIGMIPEGLVLLISTVFAIGVIRLSKRNVLSQDLYSLEALSRADILCLDKTGTITTGKMRVVKIVPAKSFSEEELKKMISVIASNSDDSNATMNAVRDIISEQVRCTPIEKIPFSSERKWSSVSTKEFGTLIMGSAEVIFKNETDISCLNFEDRENYRVVAIARTDLKPKNFVLPEEISLAGFVLLSEEVRESVSETLDFFKRQNVEIKIISGDNPITVRKLCGNLFEEKSGCIDMLKVSDEEISDIVEKNMVFGRATPSQKKQIISSLKKKGHTVAMVGDGVNDVIALKESDCAIAPATGSAAARNISQLVLLDSDFRSLPAVVEEGRRSINNLLNSSSLFLAKTIFSAVMTLIFMFINYPYPFQPIQMTLISSLTIGFPSFVLSFLKNEKRVSGSFLKNIVKNSVPAAITNVTAVIATALLADRFALSDREISSLCVTAMAVTGIILIVKIYKPLTPIKWFVIITSISGFVIAFVFFVSFFGLSPVLSSIDIYIIIVGIADALLLTFFMYIFSKAA